MTTTVLHLPDDLFPGLEHEPILIHDYSPPPGAFKGKSILNRNAISLVISGEKTMLFAEKSVFIKDDEFHFLSAGNCVASMDLPKDKPFRSILVFFDSAVLFNFQLKYSKRISAIKEKSVPESYIALKKDTFVVNFIASLEMLLRDPKAFSAEMKQLKLEELLLHLLEQYPQQLLAFQPSGSSDMDDLEIRKAMETNITNAVSLEELAFLCNVSLSTFKRRFVRIYGTSPSRWILQKRMEIARDLLQHHHEKPSEVYHKIGYENHSSFSQSFRKAFGMTPKAFQQQLSL